jgi:hypothetical protein
MGGPAARIGTGEGETWSQGEAAEAVVITNFESKLCSHININKNKQPVPLKKKKGRFHI